MQQKKALTGGGWGALVSTVNCRGDGNPQLGRKHCSFSGANVPLIKLTNLRLPYFHETVYPVVYCRARLWSWEFRWARYAIGTNAVAFSSAGTGAAVTGRMTDFNSTSGSCLTFVTPQHLSLVF